MRRRTTNEQYETEARGDFLELTRAGHEKWMRENNPDGWDDETWKAFAARCSRSPEFKARCQEARAAGNPRPHPTDDGWKPSRGGKLIDLSLHREVAS